MLFKMGILILFFLLFTACQNGFEAFSNDNDVDERARFVDVETNCNIGEKYAIVVISDVHLDRGNKDMEEFISYLSDYPFAADEKPLYCIVLGDIANNGYVSEYEKYLEFCSEIEALGIKVYSTAGNHDTYASGNYGQNYMKVINFSTFFRIKLKNTSLYVVDTADGTLGYNQFHKLEKEIKADNNKKIVFSHYAPYSDNLHYSMLNDTESAKLLALYAKEDVVFAFSGHTHIHKETTFGKLHSVAVGSILHDEETRNFAILFVDETKNIYRCVSVDF